MAFPKALATAARYRPFNPVKASGSRSGKPAALQPVQTTGRANSLTNMAAGPQVGVPVKPMGPPTGRPGLAVTQPATLQRTIHTHILKAPNVQPTQVPGRTSSGLVNLFGKAAPDYKKIAPPVYRPVSGRATCPANLASHPQAAVPVKPMGPPVVRQGPAVTQPASLQRTIHTGILKAPSVQPTQVPGRTGSGFANPFGKAAADCKRIAPPVQRPMSPNRGWFRKDTGFIQPLLTAKETNRDDGQAGYFQISAQWSLTAGDKGPGLIVQEVERTFEIKEYKKPGKRAPYLVLSGAMTAAEVDAFAQAGGRDTNLDGWTKYWEAWPVADGATIPARGAIGASDDFFTLAEVRNSTRTPRNTSKGWYQIKGTAKFYKTKDYAAATRLAGSEFKDPSASSPANGLPVTKTNPDTKLQADRDFVSVTASVTRTYKSEWDTKTKTVDAKGANWWGLPKITGP